MSAAQTLNAGGSAVIGLKPLRPVTLRPSTFVAGLPLYQVIYQLIGKQSELFVHMNIAIPVPVKVLAIFSSFIR